METLFKMLMKYQSVDNRVSVDEDKDDDDEDFVTGAKMITVPQEVVERDLSSKEITALVSVIMMLNDSETINGSYLKNHCRYVQPLQTLFAVLP
ncbi:hypothetical protein INT47_009514 [Mucor saturninus]|uniref:Uncharacterized protein n=1 Tax=Mucor saturninus TaxID=64648 RepID=A0A8H7R6D9_9FUNG|nr:hypothetical protein INT47_009514 [Mucor saturninus]